MQMINVLQRLAELDAKNPNVIKEDNSYTGYGDPRFTKITPEYEGEGPGEVEVTIADPVASDYDNNNEVMIPVVVSYVNGLDMHGRSENTIKKVVNKNTGEEIPVKSISEYDLYEIIHPALDQDVKNIQDYRRDDQYEESSLREGQNKMTNNVNECGMMGGMSQPRSPASINMTADSGAELTGMLRDIMQLAGLKQVGPADLGHEHEPAVISAEPTVSVAHVDDEPTVMRSMLDKLNPGMKLDAEQKVDEWDYEPAEATDVPPMGHDAMLNTGMHNQDPAGAPGAAKGRHLKNHPVASPETTYESLMAEYKKFISEDDNYTKAAVNHANRMGQMQPDKKAEWDDEAAFLKTAANSKSNVDASLRSLAQSGDFDEIYQALGRDDEVGRALQDMSNDISIEYGYHPDDDIEQIIDTIANQLEQKYGSAEGMAEGVPTGSKRDQTFTTGLNGVLGDDKEFEVTYDYDKGDAPRYHGSLPSPGRDDEINIVSVKDLETSQDITADILKNKNLKASVEEEAWADYKEKNTGEPEERPYDRYDLDTRYNMESMLKLAGLKK
jgi:hypothetical protein